MSPIEPFIQTVTGPLAPDALGLTDAHAHAWIAPPPGWFSLRGMLPERLCCGMRRRVL